LRKEQTGRQVTTVLSHISPLVMGTTVSQGIIWRGITIASELSSVVESVHHGDIRGKRLKK